MKVIIAGSRSIENKEIIFLAIEEAQFGITGVISGGASGSPHCHLRRTKQGHKKFELT